MECTIGIFKNCFQYFKASRYNLPLSMQVDVVYALTVVYNFINMSNLDDLGYFLEAQDEVVDKEDIRLAEAESDVVMN